MNNKKEWQTAASLLCIRLDSLGDVLMTSPAIRALKESRAERRITLLTSRSGAELAPLIPEIDKTIVYDPPWMKASQVPTNSKAELYMIEHIRKSKFDATVIFTTSSQSSLPAALFTFLADIPLRLAYGRENPYYLLTDWVRETESLHHPDQRHEVRRQLDLVASIDCYTGNENLSLQISSRSCASVRQRLKQICLDVDKPWIIVHTGATAPSRRYPPESFAEVARRLASIYGFQILFTGTTPELSLIEGIRAGMDENSFSLAGELTLEEFSALVSMAPLLISNNTGPVHLAAALNTPVVDLYALTNPEHTPWNVPHRTLFHDVPCKFCYKSICPMGHHNCLRLVTPQSVVEAAIGLLDEVKGR